MGHLQTHQIRVETEDDLVTVQIGGEGSVPGGFAKFFNRVVDSEAWARLSDAGRAAYIPMVRFADHRNQYRVQIGLAALMKYAGLSRSSIKRAVKDLLGSRLLVLLEQGGVTPDGRNESNLYQLMIPVEAKPRWPIEPAVYPQPNPQGVRARTPSHSTPEPTAGSSPDPVSVLPRTPSPARWTGVGGVAADPQLRKTKEKEDSSRFAGIQSDPSLSLANTSPDAAALLEENGVERTIARQLAAAHPLQRVIDVIDTMQFRKARGKCENPGGFIREALVKQWQTPRSVIEARAQAQTRARTQAVVQQAQRAEQSQAVSIDQQQRLIDQVIETMDDDELEVLAREVLKKYDGNSAVLSVLTRKPPRACRLMKMEIAAMLGRI